MTETHGIYSRLGLGADDLAAVRELARTCEAHDGIDLRMSIVSLAEGAPEPATSLLSYRNGVLVGFLAMYGLGEDEVEAAGLVHPNHRRQGVFRALVDAALASCRQNGTQSLLLYVDDRSAAARAFAISAGAERAFSEAKMRLIDPSRVADAGGDIEVRRATPGDIPALAAILADDMDDNPRHIEQIVAHNFQKLTHRYYIAMRAGDPVGTINVQVIDGDPYVYGFVVRPEYRGRGYGRAILAHVLRDLANGGGRPVYLEVEPDNTPAVSLYRSLGFETLVTYDYYRLLV